MKNTLALCISVLVVSTALAQQVIDASMMFGGLNRTYRLYVPAGISASQPAPLVFNLHGYTSNNVQQDLYSNMRAVADTAKFIMVLPNGTTDGGGSQFWDCFGVNTVDDVGFLSALIDVVSGQYSIDPRRIYSCGMSNGGFMSYELACQLSGRIAAIASVTGSMTPLRYAACNALHPTPVMQIHGTADPTVPYLGNATMVPIEQLLNHWVQFNNCNPTPAQITLPDMSTTDNCTADHFVYTGGTLGSSVEFYRINGGEHTWPGALIDIGVTNHDFNASAEIWRFFRQYRLDVLYPEMTVTEVGMPEVTVFPNPSSNGQFSVNNHQNTPLKWVLTDAVGREIDRGTLSGNNGHISINPKGFYRLMLISEQGTSIKQLVVN